MRSQPLESWLFFYIAYSGNHPFIFFTVSKVMDVNLHEESQIPGAMGTAMKIHQCAVCDRDYTAQFQGMGQLESISQGMLYDRKISILWSYKFS